MDKLKKYMKTDFLTLIFSDECMPTLDEPDSWVLHENFNHHDLEDNREEVE